MKKVIAALDNSLAARAVLATAGNVAELFAAEVEALHVGEDGDRVVRDAAAAAGVQLKRIAGPTVPRSSTLLQPTTSRPWWSGRAAPHWRTSGRNDRARRDHLAAEAGGRGAA